MADGPTMSIDTRTGRLARNATQREAMRARLAQLEAEQAAIRTQLAALDEGDRTYRDRAQAIVKRMADIERQARHATSDDDHAWAVSPLAIEWRRLMVEWWALPISLPESIARLSPTYDRMLTSKASVTVAGKSDGERHMERCRAHQRQLRLRTT